MDESNARATASRALQREQQALELVPIDDSVAEAPHSIGNRLGGMRVGPLLAGLLPACALAKILMMSGLGLLPSSVI